MTQTTIPAPLPTDELNEAISELDSIKAEAEVLQQRAATLAQRVAYSGPPSTAFGPATDAIADEAAVVVDRRKDEEFSRASFDGDSVRAQGLLQRAATNLRFTAEALAQTAVSLQTSATSQLGNTLYLVIDTTRRAVSDPFAANSAALQIAGVPLLRRVDGYNASIKGRRNENDRFRSTIAEVEADNQRLSVELEARRPGAPVPTPAPRPAPAASRLGRRGRSTPRGRRS